MTEKTDMKDILDRIAESSPNESSHELICRLRDCSHEIEALRAALAACDAQADELASMTRMFHAACADLGAINEALGLDPNDGGAEPILDAIEELKTVALAARDASKSPNRASSEPGGQECMKCGRVFIGGPEHDECGLCVAARDAHADSHRTEDPQPVAPRWYSRDEIVFMLKSMNYCDQIAEELADWALRHLQLAFNKGFEEGTRDAQAESVDSRPVAYHFHRFVDGKEMAEDILIERAATLEDAIKAAVKCCPKRNMTVLVHAPAWVGTLHGGALAHRADALQAQGVPAGYALVPVEPTDAMVQAAFHLDLSYMPGQEGVDRAAIYRAMLDASPQAPQPNPTVSDDVRAAVERMCSPLHESRLSGVTAQEDARCMNLIRDYVLGSAAAPSREHVGETTDCCDTPSYCSSVRRCTAQDASPSRECGERQLSVDDLRVIESLLVGSGYVGVMSRVRALLSKGV